MISKVVLYGGFTEFGTRIVQWVQSKEYPTNGEVFVDTYPYINDPNVLYQYAEYLFLYLNQNGIVIPPRFTLGEIHEISKGDRFEYFEEEGLLL